MARSSAKTRPRRTSERSAESLDAHRRRAVAAMLQVAGEHGYAASSVGAVLRRARMSRRTFYEVFRDREECFLAAYDELQGRAVERLAEAHEAGEVWPALLELALTELFTLAAAQPELARVLLLEAGSAGAPGIERYERTMRAFARSLARAAGRPAASAHEQLRFEACVGAIARVVQARVVAGRTRELPSLAPELARVVGEIARAGGPR